VFAIFRPDIAVTSFKARSTSIPRRRPLEHTLSPK
jgi:hypothetical protein